MNSAGARKMKPATGPATPISKSARLVGMWERMRMKAPNVPVPGMGDGRKKGSVASTRY
jgi:hypothetical protein